MLIQLGNRPESIDDALSLLSACHARIRKFLGFARALGERPISPAEAADVAAQVVRYFRVAYPLHVLDEDCSLLPVLRGRDAEVDAALERMSRDHVTLDTGLEPLLVLLEAIPRDGGLAEDAKRAILEAVAPLEMAMEDHLGIEERVLFPGAARLLTPDERTALREAIRARRQQG